MSEPTGSLVLQQAIDLIRLGKLAEAKTVLDQAKSKGAKGDGFDKVGQRLNEANQEPVVASKITEEAPPPQPNILDSLKLDQAISLAKKKAKDGSLEDSKRIYHDILTKFPKNKRARDGLKGLSSGPVGKTSKVQYSLKSELQSLMALYNNGQLALVVEQAQILTKQYAEAYAVWNLMGISAAQIGHLDQAVLAFNRVLAIKPDDAEVYNNMGIVLKEQGKLEEAVDAYNKALAIKPDYAEAYSNMGNAFKEQGKLEEVIDVYNKALAIKPDYAEARYNMGLVLKEQGKLEEAIDAYNKALAIKPNHAEAYNNMGIALKEQGKLEEAVAAYSKALAIKPDYADTYNNMGVILQDQGKLEEAIAAYSKALAIKPDYAFAYNNMGNALKDQGKLEEAVAAYSKALAIKPDYADTYNNMGVILQDQGKLEEAVAAYSKALAIRPDYAFAYSNMGNALKEQGKLEEAVVAYNKALAIKPDHEGARVQKLYRQAHICDWDGIDKETKLIPRLGTIKEKVSPFCSLSMEDAPERHRTRSEIFAAATFKQRPLPGQAKVSRKPKRIRLGYFSTDFKEHPVAYLMAKMLEQHDREKFEVFGYSLHGNQQTDMRQRLAKSFDSFADVQGMSDKEVALLAIQDEVDIAIDLNGYTKNHRLGIFAYRAAPIQVNYLGYPGTLGADFMDYIVADRFLIPEQNQKYFHEKPLYLPNTYIPTDDTRELSKKPFSRADMGLPNDGFVFCCFNNNYKITSAEFDIWMRLLNKVKGSVLWLRKSNEISHLNMKKEAEKRNIDPSRLVFADKVPMDEHLARQRLADLFVDTFTFNAHTTATEALWAGLPVVTKAGEGFAARVAGSLLNAVGLPELVTKTEQDYEALILELATNTMKLARIKEKLATNRLSQPLFNTEMYTRHLENGYQQAYENYFDGYAPQTITVPS